MPLFIVGKGESVGTEIVGRVVSTLMGLVRKEVIQLPPEGLVNSSSSVPAQSVEK